jgi:NAD(P)-dependent dehydrogenase (short-subunit alcohol dehydrogenase family)
MSPSWDELKAATKGEKDGAPGYPALQVLVHLIQETDRTPQHAGLHMKVPVVQLTWSAATGVGKHNKNVHLIAPGLMATGTTRVLDNDEALQQVA